MHIPKSTRRGRHEIVNHSKRVSITNKEDARNDARWCLMPPESAPREPSVGSASSSRRVARTTRDGAALPERGVARAALPELSTHSLRSRDSSGELKRWWLGLPGSCMCARQSRGVARSAASANATVLRADNVRGFTFKCCMELGVCYALGRRPKFNF